MRKNLYFALFELKKAWDELPEDHMIDQDLGQAIVNVLEETKQTTWTFVKDSSDDN